ncbi:MAG: LysM peptidoglycan-binding domain-containing protein [Acidipropionibacterium sp.]|jgi:nucleoid-associated protein YgaU|nr:LysM peptidoglycan-binding domain-containing protein [Acidipropionibacterium sp.]
MTTFDRPRGGLLTVLRGLGSTALLVALVLGSPVALAMWGRAGELRRLGPAALTSPDDGSLLLGLATVVGWLAWLVFTVCVVAEAVDLASDSRLRIRIPGLGGVQGLAAGMLVASLALLAPVGGSSLPAHATTITGTASGGFDAGAEPAGAGKGPASTWAGASVEGDGPIGAGIDSTGIDSTHPVTGLPAARTADQPRTDAGTDRHVEGAGSAQHLVGPTDSLWSVAESWYGEGTAWRRIVAANPGLDPSNLPVGQVIVLPGVQPRGETPPAAPGALPATGDSGEEGENGEDRAKTEEAGGVRKTVVVRAGDTLSGLARSHLGDAERWPEIWEFNRDLIDDPDSIDIGWRLTLPVASADSTEPPSEREKAGAAKETGTAETADAGQPRSPNRSPKRRRHPPCRGRRPPPHLPFPRSRLLPLRPLGRLRRALGPPSHQPRPQQMCGPRSSCRRPVRRGRGSR